jgi:hypothetical protein
VAENVSSAVSSGREEGTGPQKAGGKPKIGKGLPTKAGNTSGGYGRMLVVRKGASCCVGPETKGRGRR